MTGAGTKPASKGGYVPPSCFGVPSVLPGSRGPFPEVTVHIDHLYVSLASEFISLGVYVR